MSNISEAFAVEVHITVSSTHNNDSRMPALIEEEIAPIGMHAQYKRGKTVKRKKRKRSVSFSGHWFRALNVKKKKDTWCNVRYVWFIHQFTERNLRLFDSLL